MDETKITPSLPLNPSSDDYSILKEIFSYAVDCLGEIAISISMLKTDRIECIYNEPSNVSLLKRVFFNTIFLNLYRINESISSEKLVNDYFKKEKSEIDKILKKYKKGITDYRNSYLAHYKNKKSKILSPEERTEMVKSIFTDEEKFIDDMERLQAILFKLCEYFNLARKIS